MFNLACHRYDSIISVGARTTIHREYILRRISFEVRLQLFLYEYLSLSLTLTLWRGRDLLSVILLCEYGPPSPPCFNKVGALKWYKMTYVRVSIINQYYCLKETILLL